MVVSKAPKQLDPQMNHTKYCRRIKVSVLHRKRYVGEMYPSNRDSSAAHIVQERWSQSACNRNANKDRCNFTVQSVYFAHVYGRTKHVCSNSSLNKNKLDPNRAAERKQEGNRLLVDWKKNVLIAQWLCETVHLSKHQEI